MSSILKDNIFFILGILIATIQVIREIVKSRNGSKVPTGYLAFLFVATAFLIYFGFEKNRRDNNDKQALNDSISSVNGLLKKSDSSRAADNASTRQFLESLKFKFNITRDSSDNLPVFINNGKSVNIAYNDGKIHINMY